jgi:5'-nucleotidase
MISRAQLIEKIRTQEANVILLDTGDFFRPSIYVEQYKGMLEIKAMNLMQYDAACLGEQELDLGMEQLAEQITSAEFDVLCANYNFTQTVLDNKIKPYKILSKNGLKIGIIGLGAMLKKRIDESVNSKIEILDPIMTVNKIASQLRKQENCDFIICLSHAETGENTQNQFTDKSLARESENIDLIISSCSNYLSNKCSKLLNKKRKEVLIVQAPSNEVILSRIDYAFSNQKNILSTNAQTVEIVK